MAKRKKSANGRFTFTPFQAELLVDVAAWVDASLCPRREWWLWKNTGFGCWVYHGQRETLNGFRWLMKSRSPNEQYAARKDVHDLADRGFVQAISGNVKGQNLFLTAIGYECAKMLCGWAGVRESVQRMRQLLKAMGPGDEIVPDITVDYTSPQKMIETGDWMDSDLAFAFFSGWVEWLPSYPGIMFFDPTPAGREAMKKPPRTTRGLPKFSEALFDRYNEKWEFRYDQINKGDAPHDTNELGIIPIGMSDALEGLPPKMEAQLKKQIEDRKAAELIAAEG